MSIRLLRMLALWLAAAIAFAAAPARADPIVAGATCLAGAATDEGYARVAAASGRWQCERRDWAITAPRAFLRFDLRGSEAKPSVLTTRLTRFTAMRVTVIAEDGRSASRDLTEADMAPATTDWLMSTALPDVPGRTEAVVVRIDGARHVGMLSDAKLAADAAESPEQFRGELVIAALCGMLCLPLFFNFAFFRVLRQRFLAWHALAVVFMLVQTLVTSGLINRFATLSLSTLCLLSAISWGAGIVAAALFSADFIEPGKLDPLHRRLMRGTAPWIGGWTAFYLLADGSLRPLAPPLYFVSFLPVLGLFAWIMLVATRRGSRAVIFQIVGWAPIMLTGLVRIASALGATDAPMEMQLAQHVSIGLEIICTSLGVADRFMIIRRQRDLAVADLRIFEDRAERDPLTGLLNRRAVEKRFEALHAEGFRAMAVIDLDRFKLVNDTHGHVVGDAVLRAAAQALEPDDDTLAIRLGGEEFLLLLRGRDAVNRAERRRRAIPQRVAGKVPGLDRVVTASMGLVEQPADGSIRADFKALYAHCDRLLYEAKDAGRNRTMRAKMRSFAAARVPDAA